METSGAAMQITLCEDFYKLIKTDFTCDEVGEVEIKGFGVQRLYTLTGELRHGR